MKDLWLRLRNHPGLVMFFLILPYILLRAPWFQGTSLSVVGVMIVLLFAFMFITTPREKLDAALESNKLKDEMIAERNRMLGKRWREIENQKLEGRLQSMLFDLVLTDEVAHAHLLKLGLEVHQAEEVEFDQEVGLATLEPQDEGYHLYEERWKTLHQDTEKKRECLETVFALLRGLREGQLRYASADDYVSAHDQPESDAASTTATSRSIVDYTGDPNLKRRRPSQDMPTTEQEAVDGLGIISRVAGEDAPPAPSSKGWHLGWSGIEGRSTGVMPVGATGPGAKVDFPTGNVRRPNGSLHLDGDWPQAPLVAGSTEPAQHQFELGRD